LSVEADVPAAKQDQKHTGARGCQFGGKRHETINSVWGQNEKKKNPE